MKKRKRKPPRRRNVYAAALPRFGHRVKPSGKIYRRRAKHKNPRLKDGGSDVGGSAVGTEPTAPASA